MKKGKKILINDIDHEETSFAFNDNDNTDNEEYLNIKINKQTTEQIDPLIMYSNTLKWMNQFTEDTINKKIPTYVLPWIEKYRPNNFDDIVAHTEIVKTLKEFILKKQLPHLLLYGPPGTGKTSIIVSSAKALYGENYSLMVIEINASEERGIEVVRNKIKDFIITKGVFLNKNSPMFKLVILDEADAMTSDAQSMLRSVIEKYTENVRFCLICNYIKKINPAIKSRCTTFKFSPIPKKEIKLRINKINEELKLDITKDGIEKIIKISNGDMRKVINILQSTSMIYDVINEKNVSMCLGYPNDLDTKKIYKYLVNKKFSDAYLEISKIIKINGYSLKDIIDELSDIVINEFINLKIDNNIFYNIVTKLKTIEHNITLCPSEEIQLLGIIAIFNIAFKTKKIDLKPY
jgi:replication factor C subunit 3/5